jgi:hypothetical protein
MTSFFRSLLLFLAIGPTASRAEPAVEVPVEPPGAASPRELLRLFEVDESVLRFFNDGAPLSADELEPVYRLLYLIPRFDALQRQQWRKVPESWEAVAANPVEHRAGMYLVVGRVTAVTEHALPAEAARRFEYDRFYMLDIASTVDQRKLTVCAREIPARWSVNTSRQPISCDALFIKTGEGEAPHQSLVFVTDRIAWHPNQPETAMQIGAGAALLGRHGMDVSRLQEVRHEQPLGVADREGFYQMLWSVRRMDSAAITRAVSGTQLPIVAVLQKPETQVGEVFRIRGTARRAIRVMVADPDIRQRFGIDHYYEVELFMPLEQVLRLVDPRDGQTRSYASFPVTICAAALPPEMPQGDEIRQAVEVDGFFFKLWSYHSQFAAGEGETADPTKRQISPLLIASTVRLVSPTIRPNPWPGWIMAMLVAGTVATAVAARFWYARRDRPFRAWRAAQGRDVIIHLPESPPTAGDSSAAEEHGDD